MMMPGRVESTGARTASPIFGTDDGGRAENCSLHKSRALLSRTLPYETEPFSSTRNCRKERKRGVCCKASLYSYPLASLAHQDRPSQGWCIFSPMRRNEANPILLLVISHGKCNA